MPKDQTGTGPISRKAMKDIRTRLDGLYRELKTYIEAIPRDYTEVPETPIVNRRVYEYELVDRDVNKAIRDMVTRWFETDEYRPRWFFGQHVAVAYAGGAGQEVGRLTELIKASSADLSPQAVEQILMSRPYRARIAAVESRAFNEMKSFSGDTAADLARVLSNGMAQGKGIRSVTKDIRDRFEVAESRAEKIARTEIAQAHRSARADTVTDMNQRLGLQTVTQWISALADTTRDSHRERHGKLYTTQENAEFYSKDGNAIHCLCDQRSVIITEDGTKIGFTEV